MADTPLRNRPNRQLSYGVAIVAVIIGLTVVIAGLILLLARGNAVGFLILGVGCILMAVGLVLHTIVVLVSRVEINTNRIHGNIVDLAEALRRIEPMLKIMADNSEISDAARSITHREKETEALRHAIRDEMYRSNWDAAMYLVDQMESRFGYAREAEALRKEMAQVREMTIEEKIGEAISHIEKMMTENHWERARQESERLMKLFPRHEQVVQLPAMLTQRREERKQSLLKEWNLAVQRAEVEKGIQILTELDQYLTRDEASSLRESAIHVFKARLVNLGVQFSLAVSEQRWRDALEVGVVLCQEYPNSRMAKEVSEKMDVLKIRAGFTTDADITQRRPPTGE